LRIGEKLIETRRLGEMMAAQPKAKLSGYNQYVDREEEAWMTGAKAMPDLHSAAVKLN